MIKVEKEEMLFIGCLRIDIDLGGFKRKISARDR